MCQSSAPYQDSNGYEDFGASQNSNAYNWYPWRQDMDRAWMGGAARPIHPYELAGIGLCSTGHFTEILPPKFSSTFHPHHGSKSALYAST
jgi:hypothetical protein